MSSISAGASTEWDDFVRQQAGHTAFHRMAWLETVRDSLGHDVFALAARDDSGRLSGVLPLANVSSRLFGNFLVSVPFASYGGPLGEPWACRALVDDAIRLATSRNCQLLELRGRIALPVELPVSHRKITVTLNVDGGSEAVFKRFDSKLRSQIRRSEREGISVRFGAHLIGDFYSVFARHMRDLGTPALGAGFFRALVAGFGADLEVAVAYLNEKPVAGAVGFRWAEEFEITWASSLLEYKKIAPNMALYWRLIEHVADSGARVFNFGRCSAGSNTHRFKRQWGGSDEPLYWYQWSTTGDSRSTPAPGGAFALAEAVWRKLPLGISSWVGPHISRLLP